jgi:hypothetical protein
VALPTDRVQHPPEPLEVRALQTVQAAKPLEVRAVQTVPAAKPHVAKAHSVAKRPATATPRKPSKPSFFKRELLRIVIR